jgi:hypothetical protein
MEGERIGSGKSGCGSGKLEREVEKKPGNWLATQKLRLEG